MNEARTPSLATLVNEGWAYIGAKTLSIWGDDRDFTIIGRVRSTLHAACLINQIKHQRILTVDMPVIRLDPSWCQDQPCIVIPEAVMTLSPIKRSVVLWDAVVHSVTSNGVFEVAIGEEIERWSEVDIGEEIEHWSESYE